MCATLAMREAAQEIISVALQQTKARRGAAASAGSKASVSFLLSRLLLAGLFAACAPAAAGVREPPARAEAPASWEAASRLGMAPDRSDLPGLVLRAQSGACTASCRNAYNQCRVQTKGHPRCDSQFTACMQNCIPKGR